MGKGEGTCLRYYWHVRNRSFPSEMEGKVIRGTVGGKEMKSGSAIHYIIEGDPAVPVPSPEKDRRRSRRRGKKGERGTTAIAKQR